MGTCILDDLSNGDIIGTIFWGKIAKTYQFSFDKISTRGLRTIKNLGPFTKWNA